LGKKPRSRRGFKTKLDDSDVDSDNVNSVYDVNNSVNIENAVQPPPLNVLVVNTLSGSAVTAQVHST